MSDEHRRHIAALLAKIRKEIEDAQFAAETGNYGIVLNCLLELRYAATVAKQDLTKFVRTEPTDRGVAAPSPD